MISEHNKQLNKKGQLENRLRKSNNKHYNAINSKKEGAFTLSNPIISLLLFYFVLLIYLLCNY